MYRSFSIEPPQVEPAILTGTGSGQNFGWPEISAWPLVRFTIQSNDRKSWSKEPRLHEATMRRATLSTSCFVSLANTALAQRLPHNIVPERYQLTFRPDLTNGTFTG